MHIDYRNLLPYSKTCDHNRVSWNVQEPKGKPYVLVSVSCNGCPASVSDRQVGK